MEFTDLKCVIISDLRKQATWASSDSDCLLSTYVTWGELLELSVADRVKPKAPSPLRIKEVHVLILGICKYLTQQKELCRCD